MNHSREAILAALGLILRRKALRAEAQAAQRDAMSGGRYPHLETRFRELKALSRWIVQKTLAGPGREGVQAHYQQLLKWSVQRDDLEKELTRQIPEMKLEQKLRAADGRAVALKLPEGVALVEFVRLWDFDFQAVPARGEPRWRPDRYRAFVLAGGAPDGVHMIDLGEAEPIDRLITDFRAGIIAEAETKDGRDIARRRAEVPPTLESDPGSDLRAVLFDRLTPALGGRTRLLIAPDGDLTRLPFEVLPTDDGRRLIDDYQISYLSCGRDVLRFGTATTGQSGEPLIVADPDFDLDTVTSHEPAQPKAGFWSGLFGRGKKATAPPMSSAQVLTRLRLRPTRCKRDGSGRG
jgi:hypothetical protein